MIDISNLSKYLEDHARLITEEKTGKRVVAVYVGRFQPFHAGHFYVYKHLCDRFGKDNVYIGSSDKVELPKSPFNFNAKKSVITTMFGVSPSHISTVKSPYAPTEILEQFDPKHTSFVTAFSDKDAGRLKSKYFKEFDKTPNRKGYDQEGYYVVVPEFHLDINGGNVSGTQVRKTFGNKIDPRVKKELFEKMYGSFNPKIFDLVQIRSAQGQVALNDPEADTQLAKKLPGASHSVPTPKKAAAPIQKAPIAKKAAPAKPIKTNKKVDPSVGISPEKLNARIRNPDTGRSILVKTALNYDDSHAVKKAALHFIRAGKKAPVRESFDLVEHFRAYLTVMLSEGGAAGHLAHPYEDFDLTFSELEEMITGGLTGDLGIEAPVTEKLDGQNMMFSWKHGKVIFARNKGHLKNAGETAIDANGVKKMFAGRGNLEKSFGGAAEDLQAAVEKLSPEEQKTMFADGKKFMNVEIIHSDAQNVVPYGRNVIVFHNTMTYDSNGNVVEMGDNEGKTLADALKTVGSDQQKTYGIQGPNVLAFAKSDGSEFHEKEQKYLHILRSLRNKYKLTDTDKVALYQAAWWNDYILKTAKSEGAKLTPELRAGLIKRWAFSDTKFNVATVKHMVQDSQTLAWFGRLDKSQELLRKESVRPFELLFLNVGADTIRRATGFISDNNPAAAKAITLEVSKSIEALRNSPEEDKRTVLEKELRRLQAIGIDKIAGTEGLVFIHNGQPYKYTGAFAPVNRILGTFKFDKPKKAVSPEIKTPEKTPEVNTKKEVPQEQPKNRMDKLQARNPLAGINPDVLGKKIRNPETDRDILVKTALGYEDSHPVKKAALALIKKHR